MSPEHRANLENEIETATRSLASRLPGSGNPVVVETIDQEGPIAGIRFALDIASVDRVPVTEGEIQAGRDAIALLNPTSRFEAGFIHSIMNSLSIISAQELVAA